MAQILQHVEAHYENRQMPFGKVYVWNPAHVALECDCGEKVTLSATSTTSTCGRCGVNLGAFAYGIRERQGRLPDELTHPGSSTQKSVPNSTSVMRPPILKVRPGATTILRRPPTRSKPKTTAVAYEAVRTTEGQGSLCEQSRPSTR
jgi:hypothetical protein